MFQLAGKRVGHSICCMFMLVFSIFVLNACSSPQGTRLHPSNLQEGHSAKKTGTAGASVSEWKIPLAVSNGEFSKSGGWLSDDQIIYVTNQEQTSSVFSYNLHSGKNKLLYKSGHPIVTVQVSPQKKYILIHSSPSTYEGIITVIDSKGKTIWSEPMPSYELSFEWNPYNDSELLISKFNEDWTFQVFLVNFKSGLNSKLTFLQPFLKWLSPERFVYMNVDNSQPALFSPLVTRSLSEQREHTLFPKVYQFSAFKKRLMTITVPGQDQAKAVYTFYDQNLKPLAVFSMPQLSKFSDWLVPYYDYIEKKDQFLTFEPVKSGVADTYQDGFRLVSHQLKNKKSTTLFQSLNNEPLNCSPSGETCLYGNSYEKLIDLTEKKVVKWVKE